MPDVMKTVGRYEILREVGRGGMAMVYLARQTDLDRFVALKELGAFHASDPSFAQRFLRESRVAGSLSHPNICTVHDNFEHDGTPYIAMEYIERGSLRPYVGSMNLAQIGGVLEGLLAGLAHGEQHGIVHRDLKPENLMVTSDGRVKIADFGIAKATNQMQTGAFLTATGTTVGTPTYMAPEQAMAQEIGPPTDLYSVGCMAFEMFTGRVPFHDTEAPMAILLRHVNEQIPAAKSIDPKIDQDVSDWIERLLVKDPTKRTQSANDAWDEFEEIIINLLGPRWRREARLREGAAQFDAPAPLTPAPFQGTSADAAVSDEFQSFAWGNAVAPEQAPPGPATPPPSDAAPLPPEPTVGPPTPAPGPAVGADGSAPATSDGGFVTFGAPAAPPRRPPSPHRSPSPPRRRPRRLRRPPPRRRIRHPRRRPRARRSSRPPSCPRRSSRRPARRRRPRPRARPTAPPPSRPSRASRVSAAPGAVCASASGIAAVTAVFLGIVVGGAGKGGTDESSGGTPTNAASNADVEALFPAGWSKASRAPAIPGMTVSDAVAMAPRDGGQNVVVGEVKQGAANSTLLPTRFLSALALDPGEVPPRQPVRLARAKLQAWRYENLRPRGLAKPVTIFTAPTSAGVATVACVDPGADCEAIANTLKLKAGTAFPVGPSKAYAAALGKRLSGLNKQVRAGRTALRRAKTPKAQAAAVGRLAAAYTGASAAISRLDVSPADQATQAQLAKALKGTGQAYGKLAAAAGSGRKAAFAKARAGARRNEQAVAGALRGLQAAGYKVAE